MRRLVLTGVAVSALLFADPARAELHALLIGIDDYVVKRPKLHGAVNDVLGIAEVLKRNGIGDVTQLTDQTATHAAFMRAWSGVVSRARSGDVVLLSFSGHGIRVPEATPVRHTPDGYGSDFVLAPYDEAKAPSELLRDEELYDLFKAATTKGIRVVFFADACHSGVGIRGIVSMGGLPSREVPYLPAARGQAEVPPLPPNGRVEGRPTLPGVAIFSATEQKYSVREIELGDDKRPHGALSYAMALGLSGAADDTGQGRVTVGQLRRYVAAIIRTATADSQTPELLVPDDGLVLTSREHVDPPTPLPPLALVKLLIRGETGTDIRGVVEASSEADADVIWNVNRTEVRSAAGDLMASGIGPDRIQAVVAAHQVLAALRRAMEGRGVPLNTSIRAIAPSGVLAPPSDKAYPGGARIRLESEATPFRYFTVFDVTGDGTVDFIYPLTDDRHHDSVEWADNALFHVDAPITPPFGADFLVFIATPKPLTDLHQALARGNNTVAAATLYALLGQALADQPYQIGIQAAYTCARLGGDGSCAP